VSSNNIIFANFLENWCVYLKIGMEIPPDTHAHLCTEIMAPSHAYFLLLRKEVIK
jgi:hypothetical protein